MKSGLISLLFLTSLSSAFAGDFICKVMPQAGEEPEYQHSGTYTLVDLKDAQGASSGTFEIRYTSADGSTQKKLSKRSALRTKSKESEEALYAFEYYAELVEDYPTRKNAKLEDIGFYSRLHAGDFDEPTVLFMFWQDSNGQILDVLGTTGDEDFLCEENENNPKTLPKAPRVG